MTKCERVKEAWAKAYADIGAAYPHDADAILPKLQQWAPGLAARIETAEKEAEAVSVRWMNGGQGGVQAAINVWRDTWLEAIEAIRNGAN